MGPQAAPNPRAASSHGAHAEALLLLETIFAEIPDVPAPHGQASVPDVVRKNRRERARRRLIDALESRGPYPISEARRAEARTIAERWAQKGFVDAFSEVDDFEVRCAQDRPVLDAAARGDEVERFAAAERAHRDEVVKRHGFVEIRGLQLSARVFQMLDLVYVPLHVEDRPETPVASAEVQAASLEMPAASAEVRAEADETTSMPVEHAAAPAAKSVAKARSSAKSGSKTKSGHADKSVSVARSKTAAKVGIQRKSRAGSTKKRSSAGADAMVAPSAEVEEMMAVIRAMDRPRVPATHALAKYPRLFIYGGPGSGKSTLLAYLAIRAARGDLGDETVWKNDPLPFLVPARAIREEDVTVDVLARAAGAETWFLQEALSRGRALLLVDGLDEIQPTMATLVLSALTRILDAHPRARAVASARPAALASAEEPLPAGFESVRLTPMTPEEVGRFVDQWCLAAEVSLDKSPSVAEADARNAAEDLKERIRARGAIEKLAQTPLLCSVICVVHRFLGQKIPARRVALYEAITNVLLYEWDRAKFKETPDAVLGQLDAQAKRALLSRLARAMHKERAVEWPAARVIESFATQLPHLGWAAGEAAALVAHIRDRHGVLVERSPGMFGFSHLTFQEYLAAMEMVRGREYELLLTRYQDNWWHEVIVLAAGFPGAEVERLVRGLLDADEGRLAEGTMLAAQCAETAIELSVALRKEIEERVATAVPPRTPAALKTLIELGELAGPILLRRLETAEGADKGSLLLALGHLNYQPATRIIGRSLADLTTISEPIPITPTGMGVPSGVASCAAMAAWCILMYSPESLSLLLQSVSSASPRAIGMLRAAMVIEKRGEVQDRLLLLIQRYNETHPTAGASAVSSPKRVARSG